MRTQRWLVTSQIGQFGPALMSVVSAARGSDAVMTHLQRVSRCWWANALMRRMTAATIASPIPGYSHPMMMQGGSA